MRAQDLTANQQRALDAVLNGNPAGVDDRSYMLALLWNAERDLTRAAASMTEGSGDRFDRLALQVRQLAVKLATIRLAYAERSRREAPAPAEEATT